MFFIENPDLQSIGGVRADTSDLSDPPESNSNNNNYNSNPSTSGIQGSKKPDKSAGDCTSLSPKDLVIKIAEHYNAHTLSEQIRAVNSLIELNNSNSALITGIQESLDLSK